MNMKNSFLTYLLMLAAILTGCTARQSKPAFEPSDADSLAEGMADSIHLPSAAEELFDDFFFNYASNPQLQQERTLFPLPVTSETVADGDSQATSSTTPMSRTQWKPEPFFIHEEYYTLFFDSAEQMELVKDTTVSNAVVERFLLERQLVERFLFSRRDGRWMLCELQRQALQHNVNASFMSFYQHFVSDESFQYASLSDKIAFVGPDPDNDFGQTEGVITPDFWGAFAPELPKSVVYNIVYGVQNPQSDTKIVLLRGIANGLEVELEFRLKAGKWKVTRLMV